MDVSLGVNDSEIGAAESNTLTLMTDARFISVHHG